MLTPLMTAAMTNSTALTCGSRRKLASVSVPTVITPTHAVPINGQQPTPPR